MLAPWDRLSMQIEVKTTGDKKSGKFEGYASTRKLDSDRDIVEVGAFKRTLDHLAGKGLPLLWFHDPRVPIGIINPIGEDKKGLYVEGEVDTDTQLGHDKYSGMVKGYIDRMSIGYKAVKHEYDRKERARRLHEIALKEISMITKGWAANDEALVTALKSASATISHYASSYGDSSTRVEAYIGTVEIEELIASLTELLGSGVFEAAEVAQVAAEDAGAETATAKSSSGSSGDTRTIDPESGSALATLIRSTTKSLTVATGVEEVKAAAAIRSVIDGLKTDVRRDT